MNDPSTLVEFYLPLQEYLPGHHIPDVSAHACEDIEEIVKTEYIGTVSNQDIVDLAFVLDPTFVDGKTNIVFLGMVNAFICCYVWCAKLKKLQSIDLQSFPVTEMHVGCPNSIKDTFPKCVFDWIGLFPGTLPSCTLQVFGEARQLLSLYRRVQFSTGCLGVFM